MLIFFSISLKYAYGSMPWSLQPLSIPFEKNYKCLSLRRKYEKSYIFDG